MHTDLSQESSPAVSYSKKVLIADDDLFIRSFLGKITEKHIQADFVQDGQSVLEYYKNNHPAAVFLDIHMPNRTGLILLKQILEYDPEAHVILMSGDSTKDNVMEAKKHGAKGFLTKPLHKDKFMHLLKKCPHLENYYLD